MSPAFQKKFRPSWAVPEPEGSTSSEHNDGTTDADLQGDPLAVEGPAVSVNPAQQDISSSHEDSQNEVDCVSDSSSGRKESPSGSETNAKFGETDEIGTNTDDTKELEAIDDDDKSDYSDWRNRAERFDYMEREGFVERNRDVVYEYRWTRYEIMHWIYHLQQAEKLLPAHEKELMNEVWALAEKFLYDSPDSFKAWREHALGYPYHPLDLAVREGLTGLVDRLIRRGKSASNPTPDDDINVALGYIPGNADPKLVKLLLDNGADPNCLVRVQDPLLMIRFNNIPAFHKILITDPSAAIIELLLNNGAKAFVLDERGWSALHLFAIYGSGAEKLDLFLKCDGSDINIRAGNDFSPLHCLLNRHEPPIELLRAFLERGADTKRESVAFEQGLCYVAASGNVKAVDCLLEYETDIYDDDNRGRTALHAAAAHGHLEIVEKLLRRADDKRRLLLVVTHVTAAHDHAKEQSCILPLQATSTRINQASINQQRIRIATQ
jgi:ankyrin repeat protein